MTGRLCTLRALTFIAALVVSGCGGGTSNQPSAGGTAAPAPGPASTAPTDKNAYPVFPNADAGADPSVPAETGGKGFKGDGWQTNTMYDLIGDPGAVRGGAYREF